VPSHLPPPPAAFADDVGLYIFSDYPASRLAAADWPRLIARIRAGAGVLMLGGWESYHGLGGDWDATPLAPLLPVVMGSDDDRRNSPYPVLVRPVGTHPITAGLPWGSPPGIGGWNDIRPRPGAQVVLEGERYAVKAIGDGPAEFRAIDRFPLLVVDRAKAGPAGAGRRACLATDVAPHWVGGWVDWGDVRVTVRLPDGDFIEVGACYADFFTNLVTWTLGTQP
jgi:uncharacterized membrane protein